ncbi:hypothetical protein [Leifsonia sp. fls2-241-R2A-40a]|uniref:hypothetical protein n=1 Tax=Leifsonia sp. fls2-241-R2A-40a TaxID=3040290 RepID=UPI00254E8B23|nr:hypothetical protein [Leifsonia sp. fls2-241-R2A-40a]
MLASFEGIPVDPSLEIIPLTDSSWRICDTSVGPTDPGGLLAYVEREDAGFDVIMLRPGFTESAHTDCLAAALSLINSRRSGAPQV